MTIKELRDKLDAVMAQEPPDPAYGYKPIEEWDVVLEVSGGYYGDTVYVYEPEITAQYGEVALKN